MRKDDFTPTGLCLEGQYGLELEEPHMIEAIHPDGRREILPSAKRSLEDLQNLVGGHIEIVTVREDGHEVQCMCNEEGLLLDLPSNPTVTERLQGKVNMGPHAVGTWVFFTGEDMLD